MEKIKLFKTKKVTLGEIVELLNNKTISLKAYQQESQGIVFNNNYFIKGFFSIKDLEKQIDKKYCKLITQDNEVIYNNSLDNSFLKKIDQFSKISLNYMNNNKELNNFSFSKKEIKKMNELYDIGIKTIKYKDYEIDFGQVLSKYKQKKKDECIKEIFNLREYNALISGIQSGTIINNIEKENKLIKLANIIDKKLKKTKENTIKYEVLSDFSTETIRMLYTLQNTRQRRMNAENTARNNMLQILGSIANELDIYFTLNGSIIIK